MTTSNAMHTRKDYIASNCTHEEYYGQFVNNRILHIVKGKFGVEALKAAFDSDKQLNSIPLVKWDALAKYSFTSDDANKMKECGDYMTLSGQVCILKAAARQLVSE